MKIKLLSALLLLSASAFSIAGCNNINVNMQTEENIVCHGLNIKRLSSGTDGSGHPYQTFSFTTSAVYLKTATTATITFADNRANGSNYLTASVNNANKTCTVTCLAPFNSQATLTLRNGSATGTVTIDYKQKYLETIGITTGQTNRYLSYNVNKYNPYTGDPSYSQYDHHDSLLDLLNTFYSSPFYYASLTSDYTISETRYGNSELTGWHVPQGLGYTSYGDMVKSSGYSTTAEQVAYQNWFIPALSNCYFSTDTIGYNASHRGMYIALHSTFVNLSTTNKNYISTYLNDCGGNYLTIEFSKATYMDLGISYPDAGVTDTFRIGRPIHLYLQPMSAWAL